MTDLRKAAEMALKALEELRFANAPFLDKAMEALRTALAQTEQECVYPKCETAGGCDGPCGSAVEQEPVAWMNPRNNAVIDARKKTQIGEGDGYPRFSVPLYTQPVDTVKQEPVTWVTRRTGDGGAYVDGYETCEPTDYGAFPVYAAPPKREWVGLTDEDLRQIILAAVGVAEAKLKEKNA